jgi:hypothetical protein
MDAHRHPNPKRSTLALHGSEELERKERDGRNVTTEARIVMNAALATVRAPAA